MAPAHVLVVKHALTDRTAAEEIEDLIKRKDNLMGAGKVR